VIRVSVCANNGVENPTNNKRIIRFILNREDRGMLSFSFIYGVFTTFHPKSKKWDQKSYGTIDEWGNSSMSGGDGVKIMLEVSCTPDFVANSREYNSLEAYDYPSKIFRIDLLPKFKGSSTSPNEHIRREQNFRNLLFDR
jgi:hypothetical protein